MCEHNQTGDWIDGRRSETKFLRTVFIRLQSFRSALSFVGESFYFCVVYVRVSAIRSLQVTNVTTTAVAHTAGRKGESE